MKPSVFASLVLAMRAISALHAAAEVCGSNAGSPISTDRPQIANSSIVVPCGSLQFENGFVVTGNAGQRSLDLPETSVRLGVASRTELRLSVPDYFHQDDTSAGLVSGFTDLGLGVKQQLGPVKKFDVSLIGSLTLPTGTGSISSGGYDPSIQLPWSRSLSKNWTAAGQFSVAWPTASARRNLTGQASVYFDRQLTPLVDAYAEYSGAFPERGGPQHTIDFGAAYKPTPHQQLDVHAGFGLSSSTPGYFIGLGYSVRFQIHRSGRT